MKIMLHLPVSFQLLHVMLLCIRAASTSHAADVLTPNLLKVSLYTNLPGTAVSALTSDSRYPATPSEIRFLKSFNTRDALPTDVLEDFGGRIEGFLTPLESGDYYFFLRSDRNSELWISTDDKEANAALIASELDRGDPFMEPETGDAATSQPITLSAGTRYFIMVLYKGTTGGGNTADYAQVAWRKVGDTTPALQLKPIPAAFLSTMADGGTTSRIAITNQPAAVTVEENAKATFTVAVDAAPTNYVSIQWQRNGVNIPGAVGTNYTRFMDKTDNGAKFRAVVAVPGVSTNSADAIATVTDDKTKPAVVAAKGGPNRPEVTITFSERVAPASATNIANYKITSAAGALAISGAAISRDGTQVTLTTDPQLVGTNYTITINNVNDLAATTPNSIVANTTTTFISLGPWLQGLDGFVVWEAEDYDRNLDGLWFRDSERGIPSGGASMVNYNGAGGGASTTRIEYDIYFTKPGTNIFWYRCTGNDGNDDSAWFYLDGAVPPERTTGNQSVLAGFTTGLAQDFTWHTSPSEGGGQFTFVVTNVGVHTISIGLREDGAFFDKFAITTDPNFNPTTGFTALGPPVTLRQGEVPAAGASVTITRSPVSTNALENTSLTLSGAATFPSGVLFTYQWQRKSGTTFTDIPGATLTNLVINPLTMSWNGAVVRLRVIAGGDTKYTEEATITVTPETSVPTLVRATGSAISSEVVIVFSEPVTIASAQNAANYTISSSSGSVTVNTATSIASGRAVLLTTGNQTVGTKYTVTVNGVADTAATPNIISNAKASFYSAGVLQAEDDNGLLVFEAEAFDNNTDGRWIIDTARGTPSSGRSVVLPNGAGGTEAGSQLEYNLTFTKTGTHTLWYRASGDNGNDDSGYLWIDGARPPNRTNDLAGMTGFANQTDFVWRSSAVTGGGRITIDIPTTGAHKMGLARREDGSFFDKFVFTTDANFNPLDYGTFGPPETRAGIPALPTLTITTPASNTVFNAGANVPIAVQISATTRVISKVEFFNGATKLGENTNSPFGFTWTSATAGTNSITARLTDDVADSATSKAVTVIVNQPPSQPTITFHLQGPTLILEWPGGGTLQTATAITGSWTNLPSPSPYTTLMLDPQRYFRVQQ